MSLRVLRIEIYIGTSSAECLSEDLAEEALALVLVSAVVELEVLRRGLVLGSHSLIFLQIPAIFSKFSH